MAARFFILGTGLTSNWSDATNWASTSGGLHTTETVPTSADDVTLDAGGNVPCILNTAVAKVCKTLTVTAGYTSTMTFNVTLTVSGNITLGANMLIAGSSTLIAAAAGTLTSNGKTFPNALQLNASATFTLGDNWTINGALVFATSSAILNANAINCAGLTVNTNSGAGTTNITLTGGTWSASASAACRNNLTLNGNITISGIVGYNTGTLTYTAGTITVTGSTITAAGSLTMDLGGITLNNLTLAVPGVTLTLKSALVISGALITIGTSASHDAIASSAGGTQRVLTLLSGATQDASFCNATDIDSSAGQTIWSYKGTLSNTVNWNLVTTPTTVTRISVY